MEITYSLAELSHRTLLSEEELTKKLQTEDGHPLPEVESKTILKGLYTDKYQKITGDSRGRGHKESMKNAAKKLAEQYGVVGSNDLMETIALIVDTKTKAATAAALPDPTKPLTMTEAMKSQEVATVFNNQKTTNDGLLKKLTDQATDFENQKVYSVVKAKGLNLWHGKNPILSTNEQTKSRQVKAMERDILAGKYKMDGDNIIVLDNEGEPLKNSNYQLVTFEQHVLSMSTVDFAVAGKGKGVPLKNPSGGGGGTNYHFSEEDLTPTGYQKKRTELINSGDKEQKTALFDAYSAANNLPQQK